MKVNESYRFAPGETTADVTIFAGSLKTDTCPLIEPDPSYGAVTTGPNASFTYTCTNITDLYIQVKGVPIWTPIYVSVLGIDIPLNAGDIVFTP